MLSFVDALKQLIADTQTTGGAVIEHHRPPPELLQRLREYAFQRLAEVEAEQDVLLEWFTEGAFDENVRICTVHLHKLGITEQDRIYQIMSKVINLEVNLLKRAQRTVQDAHAFEDHLVLALDEIWDRQGDEQTFLYTFAKTRWLIAWNYQRSCWKATSLARMFIELSTVQAVAFFLSIDMVLATGRRDFQHISAEVLHDLQAIDISVDIRHTGTSYTHIDLLKRIGLLHEKGSDSEYDDELVLTSLGKTVLQFVLSEDNPFKDAALAIIKTEELGYTFSSVPLEITEVLQLVEQTDLLERTNQESVHTSIQLYQAGKYLDSLRVIYPSIEAIINAMLIRAGELPDHFRGLAQKAQFLQQRGIIPPDVSNAVEVFAARNRIVHGNFSPPRDYVFPLCLLAFLYLKRLLTEYHPV